jgi:N-acetylglucosaminyldiphosphoundecaprenol N-acetyl-beta-D-mannosaminyltransferase
MASTPYLHPAADIDLSSSPSEGVDRARFLGCEFDRLDMSQAVERCREVIEGRRFTQHVSINAAKLVSMRDDARLREIVRGCGIVTADGQSVVWASRLLGDPLPGRVAGIDLMHGLLELAEEKGYRVFILGARRHVLEVAVARLRARHPRLVLAGYRDGYFPDSDSPSVAAEIRDARADILFVAMSSPRKEYWLGRHGPELGVPLAMGVGGAIDVVAGVTRRAPPLLQRLGLEWLFRLLQEPRRLFRRYLVTNTRFAALVGKELAVARLPRSRSSARGS